MSSSEPASASGSTMASAMPGKYLSFTVSRERYGVPITRVQEIIRKLPVTRVPHAPKYIRGVFNLRGRVIPMADMRSRLDFDEIDDTDRTCVVVVRIDIAGKQTDIGMVVDDVPAIVKGSGTVFAR